MLSNKLCSPRLPSRFISSIGLLGVSLGTCLAQGDGSTPLFNGETHPFTGLPPVTGNGSALNNGGSILAACFAGGLSPQRVARAKSDIRVLMDSKTASTQQLTDATRRLREILGPFDMFPKVEAAVGTLQRSEGMGPDGWTWEAVNTVRAGLNDLLARQYDKGSYFVGQLGYAGYTNNKSGYISFYYLSNELVQNADSSDHKAFGFSGSILPRLDGNNSDTAENLSAYYMFGDPDSSFVTLTAGSYLHPTVYDASAGLSLRLGELKLGGHRSSSEDEAPRYLFDNVRAHDLWLETQFRSLSVQTSGESFEGGLTYGLPCLMVGGRVASITLAATYSPEKDLQVDEGSVELRLPTRLHTHGHPAYLTARYGTRSDFTVGLAFRF